MKKEIIINSTINEVRVAITEDGKLAEFFIELQDKERFIGNIYLGKVSKIAQGINAAFINVGMGNDAFLHFSDVDESLENSIITEEDDSEEIDGKSANKQNKKAQPKSVKSKQPAKSTKDTKSARNTKSTRNTKPNTRTKAASNDSSNIATFQTKRSGHIQINIKPKQDLLVQVVREAYGNKGVKVTSKIAIPGRYVVLLPYDSMIGVSKKIYSYQERRRLRSLARNVLPQGFGCIIRTAARGKSEDELRTDWKNLLNTWKEIEKKIEKVQSPCIVYQDMHLATHVIRDLFTPQVKRVIIDSKKLYKEITNYLKWASPNLVKKVEYYNKSEPIFDNFGIAKELSQTYKRKVFLQSGGSIVIDQTEAMVVIDVNSGRSKESNQEKNALNTNMEAAREIAKQMRLRDFGGMIIVDFIDMSLESNRRKLFFEMKRELARDRAKTVIYPVSQLGLIQMTRQRINQNIVEKISETCPMCAGSGRVTSKVVLINTIERWLKNFRANSREFRLQLTVHPKIAEYLTDGTISRISKFMIKYFVKIKIQQSDHVGIGQFKFYSIRKQKDITKDYI